jgi:sirohydrochlorin cobaltochelatase
MDPAIVFFCHGARAASWREPFERIVADFRAARPGQRAELAFLERMSPSLPEVIERLAGEGVAAIRVVPLFLAPGSHTREDLPALLAAVGARWPSLDLSSTSTLTESPQIRAAIVTWAIGGG